MTRSPRQAPGGVPASSPERATATPAVAQPTPSSLRAVSASAPAARATSRVRNGMVERASAPRAAVVRERAAFSSQEKTAKSSTPRSAVAAASRPRGQGRRAASARGTRQAAPMP
jgi:hypothetical protein